MRIYVAYNSYGDLIADDYSRDRLLDRLESAGYDLDDILVGSVTP